MNRKANPWISLAALVLLGGILLAVCCSCATVDAGEVTYHNRFEVTHFEIADARTIRIITDTETGVEYLLIGTGQGYGLTVLQPGTAETEGAGE